MLHQKEFYNKARIETFSDGVFAIIVTLLVFDLKITDQSIHSNTDLWLAIKGMFPKVMIWINSFLIICIVWLNHHRQFEQLQILNGSLFWLNNLLLLVTSLIPFPTTVAGTYFNLSAASAFYGLCFILLSIAFLVFRIYLVLNPQFLKPEVDLTVYRKNTWRTFIFGTCCYTIGVLISFYNTSIAETIYLLIALYFIIPRERNERASVSES